LPFRRVAAEVNGREAARRPQRTIWQMEVAFSIIRRIPMRKLFALSVSAALVLAFSGPANAAKSHHRSVQNFRAAHGAAIQGEPETVARPGYYFPGYGVIPPEQNRNLDPSNWGGG
jgi:hypothetical protein